MTDDRKRKGDQYPGVTHPALAAVKCPTCGAKKGEGCVVVRTRYAAIREGHTRTHRTRLNLWRVQQQRRRARG